MCRKLTQTQINRRIKKIQGKVYWEEKKESRKSFFDYKLKNPLR